MTRTLQVPAAVKAVGMLLLLAVAPPSLAAPPQYTVTNLDKWWGPFGPNGSGVYSVALNNANQIMAVRAPSYDTGLQVWGNGVRTDPGPPAYPPGYVYSSGHLRGFTDNGSYAVDVHNPSTGAMRMAVLDLTRATSRLLPDIPGAVMDGGAPGLSNDSRFAFARSDDVTRGWLLDSGTGTWRELSGPGRYVQPDAVNNSGAVAGRMADAAGDTVPFIWTAEAGMQAITDNGASIYGQAMAINNAGLVTGTANGRAFVFNSEDMRLTWLTPLADQSAADINSAGQIIGTFWNPPFLGVPGDAA